MATDLQASEYFIKMYNSVWANCSTDGMLAYYARSLRARTGPYQFNFDEIHARVEYNRQAYSYMKPEFHRIIATGDNNITAWLSQHQYDHQDGLVFTLNTMANYSIKDNKVSEVDFMWDQPIAVVMPDAFNDTRNAIDSILPKPFRRLTQRELQCLFYLVQGQSAKQMARELHVSPRTIETHITNIKTKLDLPSTRAVVEFAFSYRLASLSPLLSTLVTSH